MRVQAMLSLLAPRLVKMELFKFLVIFNLSLRGSVGLFTETQLVLDVIKSYDRPTAVVAKVCWGLMKKMRLAAELMNAHNARTMQFTEDYENIEKFAAEDMLIVLDLNCQDCELFLEQADKNNKFANPYRWMLLSSKENVDIMSVLKNWSILIDSEVIVVHEMRNEKILLNTVYRINSTSDYIREAFGTWTLANGLNISKEAKITASMRRKNLKGKPIAMSLVSVHDKTKTEIYNLNNFVTDNPSKSTFHNVLPLYDFMNATIELMYTDTWGYYINNSWNGMIGQIMRGDAELSGTVMFMSLKRAEVLSFLTQPIHVTTRFVFREPPLSLQNNLFILPLKSTVWMCIGALIFVLVFFIYVNARWESMKNNGKKCDDPTLLRPDVGDIAIFVASAVTQQGSNSELKGTLGRVVTFIMFLMFLFLYTSYSANIVALLQSSSDQIRTLTDLLNSKLEVGVEDEPYNRHYFTTATDRVRKAIYDNKVARIGYKPNFMSIEEGVKKLQNIDTPFVFHMNLGLGYRLVEQYFHEHEKCGLREIVYIPNGNPWTCCRKKSPYKEIYKIGQARIIEHGIGDRINRLIFARKPFCISRQGSFGSVNMMDFYPVLLCLLYGMVASVLLLVLEILVHRQQWLKPTMAKRSNSADYLDSD